MRMGTKYYREVYEKRKILRETYGGMMTLKQLGQELGYGSPKSTQAWVREHSLEGVKVGRSIRYETDLVAKIIVNCRGMF